jgi:hypothetical protein
MPSKKISELASIGAGLSTDDLLVVVNAQTSTTCRTTIAAVLGLYELPDFDDFETDTLTVNQSATFKGITYPASYISILGTQYAYHPSSAAPVLKFSDYANTVFFGISVDNSGNWEFGNAAQNAGFTVTSESTTFRDRVISQGITTGGTGYFHNPDNIFWGNGLGATVWTRPSGISGSIGGYGWQDYTGATLWQMLTDPSGATNTNLTLRRNGVLTYLLNFPASGTSMEVCGDVTLVDPTNSAYGLALDVTGAGGGNIYGRAWASNDRGEIELANGIRIHRGNFAGYGCSSTDSAGYFFNTYGTPNLDFTSAATNNTRLARLKVTSGAFELLGTSTGVATLTCGAITAPSITSASTMTLTASTYLHLIGGVSGIQIGSVMVPNGANYDIGSSSTRFGTVYGQAIDSSGSVSAGASSVIRWAGSTQLDAPSGYFRVRTNAGGHLFSIYNDGTVECAGNVYIPGGNVLLWPGMGTLKCPSAGVVGAYAANTTTPAKFTAGTLNLSGLPTSSSGLSSGDVWNDSGTLKIV